MSTNSVYNNQVIISIKITHVSTFKSIITSNTFDTVQPQRPEWFGGRPLLVGNRKSGHNMPLG